MDDKTYHSTTAEVRVAYELTKRKYHVFTQLSGKAPIDLIACAPGGRLLRISVKSCSVEPTEYGAYLVQLKKVRANKTKNRIVPFDNSECDVLAVYVRKLDVVCWIPATKIAATTGISLATSKSKHCKTQFLVEEHTFDDLEKWQSLPYCTDLENQRA